MFPDEIIGGLICSFPTFVGDVVDRTKTAPLPWYVLKTNVAVQAAHRHRLQNLLFRTLIAVALFRQHLTQLCALFAFLDSIQ